MLNDTTVLFAGNLADDPTLRFTPSGKPVAEFRVVVNKRAKNEAGDYVDLEPTGHDCTLWDKPAENLAESVRKGDRIIITGEQYTETWNDKNTGEKRYRTRVKVSEAGLSLQWKAARVLDD